MYFHSMRRIVMMARSIVVHLYNTPSHHDNSSHRMKVHLYYTPNHHDNSLHRIKVHLYYTPNHHDNSFHDG
jgi:hypothetical protein